MVTINLAGREYPMILSMKAAQELVEEFGSIERVGEVLQKNSEEDQGVLFENVNTILRILLKAGRTWANITGESVPDPLPCEPIEALEVGDSNAVKAIVDAMSSSMNRTVEATSKRSKNGVAT